MSSSSCEGGWKTYRFDEMAEHVAERVEPMPADAALYVGLDHLDSGSLKVERHGSDVQLVGTKLRMRKGDILFARRNAYLRRVALAPHDGLFSAHGMVLRAKPSVVLPEFLPFFMQSDRFMERAEGISVGSLSPTINWSALAREEFPLPPTNQQARVSTLLLAIDRQIGVYEAVVDHAGRTASSLLEFALGHSMPSDGWTSVQSRLATQWPFGSLGSICDIRSGKINSSHAVPNGRYPFFTCAPVPSRIDRYTFDTEALLLSGNNAQGVYTVQHYKGRFEARQRVYVITLKDDAPVGYQYLLLMLSRSLRVMQALSVGSTSKHLTLGDLQSIPIPLPPGDVQRQLTQTSASLKAARDGTAQRSVALRRLKDTVLTNALNGAGV